LKTKLYEDFKVKLQNNLRLLENISAKLVKKYPVYNCFVVLYEIYRRKYDVTNNDVH